MRWLRGFWIVAAALVISHAAGQGVVTAALAFAPNATTFGSSSAVLEMPAALQQRGARSFVTEVGPPSARLASWVVEPHVAPARGTIVLLHGVRADKRSLAPLAASLCDAGYRAVLVDLRGHGESSGRYLTYGAVESADVSRLLDRLSDSGVRLGRVGAYGFSYGGAVAIEVGARDARVERVVAAAPFSSLREVMSDYRQKYLPPPLELMPDSWFDGAIDRAAWLAGFDPEASAPVRAVRTSNAQLLLIHGSADTQVPLRHSQALRSASGGRSKLVVLPEVTHASMPSEATAQIAREAIAWFGQGGT